VALLILASSSLTTAIASLQALVLVPLYLDAIGARMYGAWAATGDVLLWMNSLEFGVPNLLIQRIGAADGRGDRQAAGQWFAAGVVVMAALSAGLAGMGLAVAPRIGHWMGLAGEEAELLARCFRLGVVAGGLLMLNSAFLALARGMQDAYWQNIGMVAGTVLGFGTSLAAILKGAGLWAIPCGLLVRSVVMLGCGLAFAWTRFRVWGVAGRLWNPGIWGELLRLSPATGVGAVAYTAMTNSEVAIAAMLLRPEAAAVYSVTRKLLEAGRNIIDMLTHATYGAFAHLSGSADHERAAGVYREVLAIRLLAATVVVGGYLIVNGAFVPLWVGAESYGGYALVVALGLGTYAAGTAYLMNSLYRADGAVTAGALLLLAEAVVRVPLMVAGAQWAGLPGIAAAALVTSACTGRAAHRRLLERFAARGARAGAAEVLWMQHGALLALAVALGYFLRGRGLAVCLGAAAAFGALCLVAVARRDALLERTRGMLRGKTAASELR
jgi:O-antigen/teichoic acid export membrane protein